ncbi:hypothetical protein BGX30_003138 [Mortierella sp. GBA39]|nr:hypothetical protein BGX30_003138 [Mortierella sp. GBA39]
MEDDILLYLALALNWKDGIDHVSYISFVEKFDLENQEHSQQLYTNLIKSTHIKHARRMRSNKQYSIFLKHLNQYWSTRLLKLERNKTRVHSATVATRTSRLAQDASVYESSLGFQYSQDEHNDSVGRMTQEPIHHCDNSLSLRRARITARIWLYEELGIKQEV